MEEPKTTVLEDGEVAQIIERTHEHGLMAQWCPMELAANWDIRTSMPTDTQLAKSVVIETLNAENLAAELFINKQFPFSNYIFHSTKVWDDDAQAYKDAIRTVLPQPEGPPIAFVSLWIIEQIGRLIKAIGKEPPYDPPVMVLLTQVKASGAKRTYKLNRVRQTT